MHHLSPPPLPLDLPTHTRADPSTSDLKPIPSQIFVQHHTPGANAKRVNDSPPRPTLLLAGYSYGALITTLLPPIISSIITHFQAPAAGSSYASIRLRALSLATQSNTLMNNIQSQILATYSIRRGRSLDTIHSPKVRHSTGSGVRTGGDEDLRRSSHDSYRSRSSFTMETHEKIKHSIDHVRSIASPRRSSPKRLDKHRSFSSFRSSRSRKSEKSSTENLPLPLDVPKIQVPSELEAIPDLMSDVQVAYLLVSPLQGLINSLATLWTSKPFSKSHDFMPENERKMAIDPTLALWGTGDVFVSVKRLRSWAQKMKDVGMERGGGRIVFRYKEVEGAGHFWQTREAIAVLKEEIGRFVAGL